MLLRGRVCLWTYQAFHVRNKAELKVRDKGTCEGKVGRWGKECVANKFKVFKTLLLVKMFLQF